MRFLLFLTLCLLIGDVSSASAPLECHQGTFNLQKTGTEVTTCASGAKACLIVYNKSKKTVTQSCLTKMCSPNSDTEPINVCRLTTSGISCCCHGYGCNKRQLITVLPKVYWK